MTAPRPGGTVEHPAGLYLPGTGTCPVCGQQEIPTYGGGRLGAHGAVLAPRSADPALSYRVKTCPGWGQPATNWRTTVL